MRILLKKNIYIHIYILLNNQKKNLVYSLQELFSFISEKRKIKSIKNNIYLNKKLNISIIDYVILIYNLNNISFMFFGIKIYRKISKNNRNIEKNIQVKFLILKIKKK